MHKNRPGKWGCNRKLTWLFKNTNVKGAFKTSNATQNNYNTTVLNKC
jgi:hypothetical protein